MTKHVDDFNRADSPTTLGTTSAGRYPWGYAGAITAPTFGITGNQAFFVTVSGEGLAT